jgi:hypothetical protein
MAVTRWADEMPDGLAATVIALNKPHHESQSLLKELPVPLHAAQI